MEYCELCKAERLKGHMAHMSNKIVEQIKKYKDITDKNLFAVK